jgi:surface protein
MKALFFLSLLPAVVFSFEVLTDSNIKQAVKQWIDNPDDALDMYGEISLWDTSQVTNMNSLFYTRGTFNDDISGWNVAKVNDMGSMFHEAWAFNQDISGWNVANVKLMRSMF